MKVSISHKGCTSKLIIPIVSICLLNFPTLVTKVALRMKFFKVLSLNRFIKSYKMTQANPMICIWFSPTKMNISPYCHNDWMSVSYNTKSYPLSYLVSNICQEPSPAINILSFYDSKF